MTLTNIEKYYKFLQENPDKACHKILTTYKKLVDDLHNGIEVSFYNEITEETETHRYIFDREKAERPIKFIEQFCRHSKGKWAGKPIKLELFQKAFIEALYGFVDQETGLRKYKKAVFLIGRKNGKSTLDSGLGNYMLMKDNEGGPEIYAVAVMKEQAKIVWEEAKRMVKQSPALNKRIRTLITGMYYDKNNGVFKALASESNSLDGLNTSFGICDEIHAWKDKNLLNVIYDSMSAREQPLILETSTMGTIRESVFDSEYEYCEDIINGYEGRSEVKDETVLPIIYELDNPLEWQDEKKWFKANPRTWYYQKCKRFTR